MTFLRDVSLGLIVSLGMHVTLFWPGPRENPARAAFDRGDSAVTLTIMPSPAAVAREPTPAPKAVSPPAERIPVATPMDSPVADDTIADAIIEEPFPEPAPSEAFKTTALPEEPDVLVEKALVQALEQDGSLEDKGVFALAEVIGTFHPRYPPLSRKRGEEGSVLLEVAVGADGRSDSVRVLRSCGHNRLDRAAVQAMQNVRFTPAKQRGTAISSRKRFDVSFELKGAN
ncbi:MAG: energy transducer TonB [Verrucomicrobia bacterium]|nr:energy transducer TonB [Verrucomicrobiota bacterium]